MESSTQSNPNDFKSPLDFRPVKSSLESSQPDSDQESFPSSPNSPSEKSSNIHAFLEDLASQASEDNQRNSNLGKDSMIGKEEGNQPQDDESNEEENNEDEENNNEDEENNNEEEEDDEEEYYDNEEEEESE